jgi:hypothetical protein
MPAHLEVLPLTGPRLSLDDKSNMTDIASAADMAETSPFHRYLAEIDVILAKAAPDGCDASFDGPEWVAVRKAYANKVPAEKIAFQLVQAREWLDYQSADTNDPLLIALRMSDALSQRDSRIGSLERQAERIANYLQGQPTREQYDALHHDFLMLSDQVKALSEIVANPSLARAS